MCIFWSWQWRLWAIIEPGLNCASSSFSIYEAAGYSIFVSSGYQRVCTYKVSLRQTYLRKGIFEEHIEKFELFSRKLLVSTGINICNTRLGSRCYLSKIRIKPWQRPVLRTHGPDSPGWLGRPSVDPFFQCRTGMRPDLNGSFISQKKKKSNGSFIPLKKETNGSFMLRPRQTNGGKYASGLCCRSCLLGRSWSSRWNNYTRRPSGMRPVTQRRSRFHLCRRRSFTLHVGKLLFWKEGAPRYVGKLMWHNAILISSGVSYFISSFSVELWNTGRVASVSSLAFGGWVASAHVFWKSIKINC